VIPAGDRITLCDFEMDASREEQQRVFRFARSNYDALVSEVVRLSREQAAGSI
jgi:hypothetical protein